MRAFAGVLKRLTPPAAVLALAACGYAQAAQPAASQWSRKKAAEDAVAKKIDEIRAAANRPPLMRVRPSAADVQLVCTTALTGARAHDFWGSPRTYVTSDLSAETEPLKKATLGLPRKDYPRYSVVVLQNANSTPERSSYTVGVRRRPSAVKEFFLSLFAPLFADNPFEDVNRWKKQIAPGCKNKAG